MCVGEIPEGMSVCHTCDNPRCVRPDHMFVGTHIENVHDMHRKGRQSCGEVHGAAVARSARRGEAHPLTKFSDAVIAHACELRRQGWLQRQIAAKLGMSRANVSLITRGKSRLTRKGQLVE